MVIFLFLSGLAFLKKLNFGQFLEKYFVFFEQSELSDFVDI